MTANFSPLSVDLHCESAKPRFTPEFKFTVIFALTSILIFHYLQKWKSGKSKGSKIHGPSTLPLIGCIHHIAKPGVDVLELAIQWSNKYKRIIRGKLLWKEMVVITDPALVQKVLALTAPEYLDKSTFVNKVAADFKIDRGLVFSNYSVWHSHRKVIGRTLSNYAILEQLKKVNLHSKELMQNLLSSSNNKIDGLDGLPISKLVNTTALEIILHIIMDLEITSKAERLEFHKHLMIAKSGFSERFKQPWLLLPPIYWLHPLRRRTNKSIAEVEKFVKVIINRYEERNVREHAKKSKNEADNANDVNHVKCMMREMIDAGFSDEDMLHEVVNMIFAGHETTSGTIILFLIRLALNPEIQKRCREEVDELYSRKLGQGENLPNLTLGDLNELEYLDRCMKETLRLTPIVPGYTRTLNAPLELEEDIVLEKGVLVTFMPWVMHRNAENFPEPKKFDPDRFLPKECAKRHPYAYLPFSTGARKCLGWKIAPLTIKLMTAMILRHFEIETTENGGNVQLEFDVTLKTKNDNNIILKKRHDIK